MTKNKVFKTRIRSRKGFTLIEVLLAMSLMTFLMLGSMGLLVAAVGSWYRNIQKGTLDNNNGFAIRKMAEAIRSSVSVTVDGDGQGITYYKAGKTGNPLRNIIPLQTDGVQRRIYRSNDGKKLMASDSARPLITNLAPTASGRIFTMLSDSKAVMLTVRSTVSGGKETWSASKTEVVRMRNLQ